MGYLIAHAMTIEGVFVFIVVLSIIGVSVQDWIDRYLERKAKKTRKEMKGLFEKIGIESYNGGENENSN